MSIPAPLLLIDQLKDGDAVPLGKLVLHGWVADEGLRTFSDLRITIADRIFPAVLGFPRTDVVDHFKLDEPFFAGGYEAEVHVSPGEQTFTFEAQHVSGQWMPVGKLILNGTSSQPTSATSTNKADEVQPHEFSQALKLTLRHAANHSPREAAAIVTDCIPKQAILRHPVAPLHGHLHQPALLERAQFGRIRISGWIFHETQAIKRVIASLDMQIWQDLDLGDEIAYVSTMFPNFPHATKSGIKGLIDTPAQFPSPLCLRIIAQLDDGSWHLAQVIRTHTWDIELEKAGYAPFSQFTFYQSTWALRKALKKAGFSLPNNRLQWKAIRGVLQEYRDGAPRQQSSQSLPDAELSTVQPGLPPPRKVTLITHNLNMEGAPLFLWELAQQLSRQGTALHVVSAEDGPLAGSYQQLGAQLTLVDIDSLWKADSVQVLNQHIRRLSEAVDLSGSDLVISNTLSTYWGVHLAHLAKKPSLLYIHESTTPTSFYHGHMAPATLPVIQATFQIATHVSFLTEATRAYYQTWLGPNNHSINPGWIHIDQIDQYLAANPREQLRQKLNLDEKTKLVVNVGSVCDRKGQHIFIRGIDLLARFDPALVSSCRFLMVGGRETLFDRDMKRLLKTLGRPNLEIIPETDTPLQYYAAADLFVCTSYEESFPRVVMEAMACRLPILSTDVHGIPHMIEREKEGRLIPPGNTAALCDHLSQMLTQPDKAQLMAQHARQQVVENFDAKLLLPQHAALISSLAHRSA